MKAITIVISASLVSWGLAPAVAHAQDAWAAPAPPAQAPAPPAEGSPPAPPAPPPTPALQPPPAMLPPPPVSRRPFRPLPEGAHFAAPDEVCYPAPPPGETHDGFYLRLQIGGGYLTAKQANTNFYGGGIAFGFALGAVVLPNLAVFGTMIFHSGEDPTFSGGGGGESGTLKGETVGNYSFGAGLAYYLEPVNVYAAAAVLGTQVDLTDAKDNRLASSNVGLGFAVMVGKEWWVGREWALGVAGEITGASMTDADNKAVSWNSYSYSLLFSATYN